ncbi:MAG TPA: SgcJ/EcaC family oxidoreductase [Gemmatimonadaceae bacterium]|nr:SgcJ/EcaC family oxidoreductase [Gemmatimonadaceae bacterium]
MRKGVLLAGALSVIAGCTATASTADDEVAIRQAVTDMTATMKSGDQAAIAALFTSNGVIIPPNEAAVAGRAAIQAWGEKTFAGAKIVEGNITLEGLRVSGNWASSYGLWAMKVAVGKDTISDTTRWSMDWERQPDGKWLVSRDIWNSGKPVAPAR